MSNQPLFQVTNHHGEACGVPPQIDEQTFSGVYRSYFENQNGEQAVFLYDYEQECGTLYSRRECTRPHASPPRAPLVISLLGS